MAGGRPSAYCPEFCDQVIQLGREGKSKAQIAAALDVARQTLDNWADGHPEFLDALTRARDYSQAWWEDKAQAGLDASGFNASLWSRSMAARFPDDYTERQKRELTGKDGSNLMPDRVEIVGVPANGSV